MFAVEYEPVSVEDVKKLLLAETAPVFHEATDPFKPLRRKQAPVALEGFALAWMARLPREVQPRLCAHEYARIVNKIAALWDASDRAASYLDELLIDRRGKRKGFPVDVAKELRALRAYHLSKYTANPANAWVQERLTRA